MNELPHCMVSMAKSRSATAFIELYSSPSNPSSLAIISRSIWNGFPASAPVPSGQRFTLRVTSRRRCNSLANAVAWDSSQWLQRTGCAFCRWVYPGMM